MPNLSALKDKLSALKGKFIEKTDKIGFLRKWREKAVPAEKVAEKTPASSHSLGSIYREGNTSTRLQVIAFYIFIFVAVVSAGSLFKKVAGKFRGSEANEQLKKDYSNGLAEIQRKALEKADLLSLGQFTANAYVGSETKLMKVDLWVRVNSPDAAAAISSRDNFFRDKTIDALSDLFAAKVNPLSEAGKVLAREKIKTALNSGLTKGEVEEVFMENLIVQ